MEMIIILSELVALFMVLVFGTSFWEKYDNNKIKRCACVSIGLASISFFILLLLPMQDDFTSFLLALHMVYNISIVTATICSVIAYFQMFNVMQFWLRFISGIFLVLGISAELICITCLLTL